MDEQVRAEFGVIEEDCVLVPGSDHVEIIDLTGVDDSDMSAEEDQAADDPNEDNGSLIRSRDTSGEHLHETEDEFSERQSSDIDGRSTGSGEESSEIEDDSSDREGVSSDRSQQQSEVEAQFSETDEELSEAEDQSSKTEEPGPSNVAQGTNSQQMAPNLATDFSRMQYPIEVLHRPENRVQRNNYHWDWDFDARAAWGPWSPAFLPADLRPIAYVKPIIRAPAPDAS